MLPGLGRPQQSWSSTSVRAMTNLFVQNLRFFAQTYIFAIFCAIFRITRNKFYAKLFAQIVKVRKIICVKKKIAKIIFFLQILNPCAREN